MAARFCSQCGNEVSSAARFCRNCAAPLLAPETTLESVSRSSRRLLLPAAIAALMVLTIAVALLANRPRQPSVLAVQTISPAPAASVLSAPPLPVAAAPPVVGAPATPAAPAPAVTNAPVQAAPTLPGDVAAYLTFLQGIEQRRIAMNADLSGATAMMTLAQQMQADKMDPESQSENAPGNVGKISQGFNDYSVKWQTLIRDFRAQPPPAACVGLANPYLKFLSDYTTVIGKLQVAILNHDSSGVPMDMGGILQVQSQMNADAAQADNELGNLCSRFGVAKPFAISPEGASPSLLGQ